MKQYILKGFAFALALLMCSCLRDKLETIVIEEAFTGIPNDALASPNPSITDINAYVPNFNAFIDYINGIPIIRIDMTGVRGQGGTDWLRLYGTSDPNQNIWVEVDDVPKGIDVYNNADNQDDKTIMTDIVFAVDNSGSMSEEADALARDIVSWSTQLSKSGLNVRYGVVGYDGEITGAINLTSVDALTNYLNVGSGITRTAHFDGSDASTLKSKSSSYYSRLSYECGVAAIRFANDVFSFRSGANRIYVNFTDEPNQPNYLSKWSVRFFESQDNWPASNGAVHTVYSGDNFTNKWNQNEHPWLISDYTGGTTLTAPSDFSGVTLEGLPVTGAMENSYIIRFANVDDLLDGKTHKVHITIRSKDGTVKADKVFYIVFS